MRNIIHKLKSNSISRCMRMFLLIILISFSGSNLWAQSNLCASSATTFCCEYVSSVSINGVVRNTANTSFNSGPGYQDFSSSSITNLVAGNTYPVSVTVQANSTYLEYVKVWFDFNGNGNLQDAGELVMDQNATFVGTRVYTGDVTIPTNAYNGQVYIRVIMVYSAVPQLCGSYTYGNTLDFKATISGGLTPRTLTVARAGTAGFIGHVSSSPAGINTAAGISSANFADGSNVTLTATPASGGNFVNWTGSVTGTTPSINVNMNGDKSVTANFAANPPSTPTSISATSTTLCNGSSTQLTAAGAVGTVYWYTESCGGTLVGTGNSITVAPTTTTNYYARNFANSLFSTGCASINVNVSSNPTATISAPSSTTLCAGSAITLYANTGSGLSYQWRLNGNNISGATNANYIANAGGSYTVVVSQNGCSSTSNAVVISPDVTQPVAACKNVNLVLNSSGTATISIPATTQTLIYEDWSGDNQGYYANTSTLNWNVTGDIDRADYVAGMPGIEIDLSGFGNGAIESKQTFNFTPGTYTISFLQTANTLSGNAVRVDIGSLFSQTFVTALTVTSESATFTVTSNASAKLKLTQLGTSDPSGSFVGQIRLVRNISATLAIENGSTDNCSIASITASKTNFTCSDIGSNTVTLTVTDGSGNVGTCQAIVTVVDNILPVISSCPTNITLNATSAAGAVVNYTTPTATDACQVTVNRTTGFASGSTFPIGTTTVTHTATDAGGNVVTCSFTVTVSGLPPVIVNPGTINANTAIGQCKANVTYAATETTGVPASTITYSIPPGSSFNLGTTAVTATATNAVGSSSTTFNVVVTDNQLPIVRTKNNLFINLGPTGTVTLTAADIDSGSTDACGIQSRTISPSTFTCANVGPINITLTVTDVNGNVDSKVATAFVIDNIAPTVVIKPVTTYLNASGTATITAAQVDNGTTDNCGIASISLDKTSFSCSNASTSNSGVLTVKTTVDNQYSAYISTDDNIQGTFVGSGNNWPTLTAYTSNLVAGQTYYLHVFAEDLGGPEMMIGDFAVTGDFKFMNGAQTMSTNAAYWKVSTTGWSNYVPALDVGPNGTAPWGNYPGVSSSARFIWRSPWNTTGNDVAYFTTPIIYTGNNTVLFTATDVNGNGASAIANITVLDTISPIINCPANINTVATSPSGAIVSYTTPTATDNCSSATVSRIAGPASGSTFPLGITTVTYKAVDPSGNNSTCSFTVNVSGVAPVIVSPGTISANTTAGQCKAAVTYAATETTGIPASTITYSIPSGSLFNVGTTTVTATATNVLGSSSTTFNVVVTDNQAPTAIAQNVTVQLDANGVGSTSVAAVNNGSTDACGIATVTLSKTNFTCSDLGANTVTLTVTDVNGNVSTTNATVTVSDAILPTISAPADINLTIPSCQTANTTVTLGNAVAADNCSVTITNNAPTTFPVGSTSVVWTATDAAGNTATAAQIITITKLPALLVSSTKDINCSGPNSGSVTATATGGRTPYQYQLNSGAFQNNGNYSNLAPGVYSVTVKDADNCTAVQNQITLTEPFCLQAVNDAFDNCAGKPITIQKSTLLGNDANPWNVSIYMDVAQPANGTVVDNGTSITYTPNANFSGIDQFNYTIKKNDGTIAFAGNGHVYEWVPFYGVTWNSARAAAALRYYNGMQGYLVTVTSQAEMNFVSSKLQGAGWMGASDRANEGVWRWVTGPEGLEENGQGRQFSSQFKYPSNYGNCAAATAPALMGQYANWAGGEPNDCGAYLNQYSATDINRGGEHYAHFYGQGIWNDYPDNVGGNIQGYIVEYGGLEGSVASTGTSTATITIDNKQVILSETVVPTTCATSQDGSITVSASGGTEPYSYNWGGGITTSSRTGLGTGNYTVTVTDAKGCIATKTITVNVGDNIPPVAIAKNITVALDAAGTVSITASQVNDGSYDNCSIQSMSVTPSTFNCSAIGPNTVTLTVTDNFNNTSTTTANVTIQDITAPIIICASDVNATSPSSSCSANVTVTSPTVTDNCLTVTLTNNITNTSNASGIYPVGTTIITWTATDASGNVSTCQQNIIVTDNIAPIAIANNVLIKLNANGNGSTTAEAVNNGSSDACGIASLNLSKTDFNCSNIGANNVTLTVTDVNGNVSTVNAVVTVVDSIAPIALAKNITVTLVGGTASISASEINNGSNDACGIASMTVVPDTFSCSSIGVNTVTLTVIDVNGNSSSTTAQVTVVGEIPTASVTQGIQNAFTQGGAVVLTATSPTATQFNWNSGPSTATYNVYASGIYTVTATNSFGCKVDVSTTVNYNASNLLSSYVIIGKDEVELEDRTVVYNGGVGVTSSCGKLEVEDYSLITASGTFGRARNFEVKSNSAVTTRITSNLPSSLLPAFSFNPYCSGSSCSHSHHGNHSGHNCTNSHHNSCSHRNNNCNHSHHNYNCSSNCTHSHHATCSNRNNNSNSNNKNIGQNTTVTITDSIMGTVVIGKNAIVTFTSPDIYIKDLEIKEGASVRFTQCAEIRVCNHVKIGKGSNFNTVNSVIVTIYVEKRFNVDEGSNVTANVYSMEDIKIEGKSGQATTMRGMFIGDKVEAKDYVNFYWNTITSCTNMMAKMELVADENGMNLNFFDADVYPNPTVSNFNIRLFSSSQEPFYIEIYDIGGRLVETRKVNNSSLNEEMGMNYQDGVYIIKVTQENNTKTMKLVKATH